MKNIIASLFSKIFPQIVLTLVVGSTIATGAVAGVKMIKANATEPALEIQQVQPAPAESTPAPSPTKILSIPTSIAPTFSVSSAANNNTQCVIALFGKKYDVTSLRKIHPGGDIFICGTDQSTTYQKTHGSDMSRMQPYLVTGSTTTTGISGSTGTTGSSISTSTFQNDDDEESDEERSRYTDRENDENDRDKNTQEEEE